MPVDAEIVPRAFVEIAAEVSYESDSLRIRCLRTGLCYNLTREQVMGCPDFPPKPSEGRVFVLWFRQHMLHPAYVVRKK